MHIASNNGSFDSASDETNSTEHSESPKDRSFIAHGLLASAIVTTAYFAIVSVAESFSHAISQFVSLAYLFVPLIATLGIQISLFSYARKQSRSKNVKSVGATASGGMSTASMILCCVHHLSEIAAFAGFTAATLFLTTYQPAFLVIGVVANSLGILTALLFLQKNMLYNPRGILGIPMRLNLTKIRKFTALLSVIVIVAAFSIVAVYGQPNSQPNQQPTALIKAETATKTASQNGLTVQATVEPFSLGDPIKIWLVLDTHSGSLSYDLAQLAQLKDSDNAVYAAKGWSGTYGGHHVAGTLTFPSVSNNASSIQLTLSNLNGAQWTFDWSLT